MVSRTTSGDQNIFGITLNWSGAGNPDRGGSGPGPGGEDGGMTNAEVDTENREEKKHRKSMVDYAKEGINHAQKTVRSSLGINVGIASLLKQSQLFTGTLGTIFQILGAMVDVVLAAFMPLIIPALKTMANSIPQIQEKMERVRRGIDKAVEKLTEWNEWLKGNKLVQALKSGLGQLFQYWLIGVFIAKITGLWTPFWVLHKYFGFATLKALGLMSRQVGVMRTASNIPVTGPQHWGGPGGPATAVAQGWGRGPQRLGMRGVTPGTAGFGALGIAGGVGAGYAMGGTGGAMGAAGFAVAGGIIGSAVPGIGTMLGATAGSIIGGMLVSYLQRERDATKQEGKASLADLLGGKTGFSPSMRTSPNATNFGIQQEVPVL